MKHPAERVVKQIVAFVFAALRFDPVAVAHGTVVVYPPTLKYRPS